MLYTKKGDDGKTNIFGCDQRFSKSSEIIETLGCLDEVNSYLGFCKVKVKEKNKKINGANIWGIVEHIQNDLFVVQAQVAGANKGLKTCEVNFLEEITDEIEKELPKIKTFIVPGANETSALFDISRTMARKTERRVISLDEKGILKIDKMTLVFLNRLSSLLYALARYVAKDNGVEKIPEY